MTIREEFERAFKDWVNITCLKQMSVGPDDAALWAAKWMAREIYTQYNSGKNIFQKIEEFLYDHPNDH